MNGRKKGCAQNMKKAFIVFAYACAVHVWVMAQEQEPGKLKTALNTGVTLTEGNSKTLQANMSLVTDGEKIGLGSVRAGVEGNYGESTSTNDQRSTTIKNARAFGEAKKTITPRTFGYLAGSALYDEIAKIDYRATVGPGLGGYLVKNDSASLSMEAGLAYVWENVADKSSDYIALRAAERFEYKLGGAAKIWQSAEYLAKADDFDAYLFNGELGVESAMTDRLKLRAVLQDKYDSTPREGLKKNDLTLIAGLSISL